ncbi:MAG: cytotoxic translational repressor of toxin-antitoxin stability system [Deltaproteobacteria bacterium]|nr:cytotoxic translational repressor of toxin-antitoxin stability system [Deltaproteobacteria bacterium]
MAEWKIDIGKKVVRQIQDLPDKAVKENLFALLHDIELHGPVRGDWPNYSKLKQGRHHCHIKKGKPTYVAVWEEQNKKLRLIEVIYVGTHEKAPY